MKQLALAIVAAWVTLSSAQAGNQWTTGQGTLSCGTLVASAPNSGTSNPAQYFAFEAWVDGFLSGANNARNYPGQNSTVGEGTDPPGRDAWILNYCQAHPLDTVFKAAMELEHELFKR